MFGGLLFSLFLYFYCVFAFFRVFPIVCLLSGCCHCFCVVLLFVGVYCGWLLRSFRLFVVCCIGFCMRSKYLLICLWVVDFCVGLRLVGVVLGLLFEFGV